MRLLYASQSSFGGIKKCSGLINVQWDSLIWGTTSPRTLKPKILNKSLHDHVQKIKIFDPPTPPSPKPLGMTQGPNKCRTLIIYSISEIWGHQGRVNYLEILQPCIALIMTTKTGFFQKFLDFVCDLDLIGQFLGIFFNKLIYHLF